MIDPLDDVRAFVSAALLTPVLRESVQAVTRRRWAVAVTLVIGTGTNAWALDIEPGDRTFYVATALLGTVWLLGAWVSGPLHVGRA